jgi:preprotein translocase subunit SecF
VTGISTLLALGAIMILGGEVLFDFSFALFIGLIVGTYSSIFVASPLLYMWRKRAL